MRATIRSGVAGRSRHGIRPGQTKDSACFTRAHTDTPRRSGGSPTAFELVPVSPSRTRRNSASDRKAGGRRLGEADRRRRPGRNRASMALPATRGPEGCHSTVPLSRNPHAPVQRRGPKAAAGPRPSQEPLAVGMSYQCRPRRLERWGWWRWEESNLRHGAYETPALPLSYTARASHMVGAAGPVRQASGTRARCAPSERSPRGRDVGRHPRPLCYNRLDQACPLSLGGIRVARGDLPRRSYAAGQALTDRGRGEPALRR